MSTKADGLQREDSKTSALSNSLEARNNELLKGTPRENPSETPDDSKDRQIRPEISYQSVGAFVESFGR